MQEYHALFLLEFHSHGAVLVQVVLVRWNEPFQKLATCDMEGGIFVWIQYEGRWSVELVNDRGAQVCIFTANFSSVCRVQMFFL